MAADSVEFFEREEGEERRGEERDSVRVYAQGAKLESETEFL